MKGGMVSNPRLCIQVEGGVVTTIVSDIELDITLFDIDNAKAGGPDELYTEYRQQVEEVGKIAVDSCLKDMQDDLWDMFCCDCTQWDSKEDICGAHISEIEECNQYDKGKE